MTATEKISVTIGREELRRAKRLALRLGLSLSTFISDAVRQSVGARERQEAGRAVIAGFPPEDRPSADDMRSLRARWETISASHVRQGRTRKARAAAPLRSKVERRSA